MALERHVGEVRTVTGIRRAGGDTMEPRTGIIFAAPVLPIVSFCRGF